MKLPRIKPKGDDRRFYVVVSYRNKTYWAHNHERYQTVLHPSPLTAEAYTEEQLNGLKQFMRAYFTGANMLPLECNTRAIIPANMRKLINV